MRVFGSLSRSSIVLISSALAMFVLIAAVIMVPVPYALMSPGPTFDTLGEIDDEPVFTVGGQTKTYPTKGSLRFTTVSVTRSETEISLLDALQGWLDDDVNVVPHDLLYGDTETNEESKERGQAQLASSKDASTVAGLRAAGWEVKEKTVVMDVVADSPADGVVKKDDVVTAINKKAVKDATQVAQRIRAMAPGTQVTVAIVRAGKPLDVTLKTAANPEAPTTSRIGIMVRSDFDMPVAIDNNVGESIGGASAGLMFALGIYDKLTPDPLTNGLEVAGTGTIDPQGRVGPIGGVRQKMAGAAKAGAEVFLVPSENCAAAADGDDLGMRLVKVETLEEAIDSISALADDPKAKVPSCR